MSKPLSSASLRFWHPKLSVSEVVSEIGMELEFSRDVGHERCTPKGRPLGGVNSETYCCFRLKKKSASHLHEDVRNACSILEKHLGFLDAFVITGGRLEFYASIFLDGDRGFELDNRLLRRMDAIGLGLSVEMYRLHDGEVTDSEMNVDHQ